MDEKRMENLPEAAQEPGRVEVTVNDLIYTMLLWLVTVLYAALVIKVGGWVVWLVRGMLG